VTNKYRTQRCEHGFDIDTPFCPQCSGRALCPKCVIERPKEDFEGHTYCSNCRAKFRERHARAAQKQREIKPARWNPHTNDAAAEAVRRIRDERKAG
jgi:uncharacterized Zn finger protein (UPF0148 family)